MSNIKSVNGADIAAVTARAGANVSSGTNYLFDLDANGAINNADVSAAKARSGLFFAVVTAKQNASTGADLGGI